MNPLTISVIIPTYNSSKYLEATISSLKRSLYPISEIIVVDDHSNDKTVEIIKKHDIKYISGDTHRGANFCRNLGARNATGDILVFLDSDVSIKDNTFQNMILNFSESDVAAVVGLYAVKDNYTTIFGKYKNLWIRYSYLKSDPTIDWVFGAISGIKKDVFFKLKGFDESLKTKQIDDLDLGKRISGLGYKIILNSTVEVYHFKEFTFSDLMKNELNRSTGFVKLAGNLNEIIRSLFAGFANVYPAFIISVILAFLISFNIILIPFISGVVLYLPVLTISYCLINLPFLKYFAKSYTIKESLLVIFILYADHLVCLFGSLKGLLTIISKSLKKKQKLSI